MALEAHDQAIVDYLISKGIITTEAVAQDEEEDEVSAYLLVVNGTVISKGVSEDELEDVIDSILCNYADTTVDVYKFDTSYDN